MKLQKFGTILYLNNYNKTKTTTSIQIVFISWITIVQYYSRTNYE